MSGKGKPARDRAEVLRIIRDALPGLAEQPSGKRDSALAAEISRQMGGKCSARYVNPFRKYVEQEIEDATQDLPDDAVDAARVRYLRTIERLASLIEERMVGLPDELFGAYVGAIKSLFELAKERARYEGVKPPDESAGEREIHLHMHFDPDPAAADGS